MKKYLTAMLILSAAMSCGTMQQDTDVYTGTESAAGVQEVENKAKVWLNSLCCKDLGGRTTGTEYSGKSYDYLRDELEAMGLEPETQTFEYDGVIFRNLIVTFDRGKDLTVVTGSHYDGAMLSERGSFYPAAEDNASGCVANLVLLYDVLTQGLDSEYNLVCCFWDAEEVYKGSAYKGSAYFVENCSYIGDVTLYINLDTLGHRVDELEIIRSDRVQNLVDALVAEGRFNYSVRDPYDLSSSDYVSFQQAGVHYVALHDVHGSACKARIHTTADKVSAISSEKLVEIAGETKFIVENFRCDE